MINSVSSSASVTAQYMHDQKPPVHAAKAKKAEARDTVVLSEKARAVADSDGDGD
jgi:hypothetical protein